MEVGGRFKREAIYTYVWLICVDVWQKSTQQSNNPPIKNKIKFLKQHRSLDPAPVIQ